MASKKVTIHSDGTGPGTVILTEDGDTIAGISDATIWLSAGEINRVDLTLIGTPVIIEGYLDSITFFCPNCEESVPHECKPKTLSDQ